jgi:hypothetical protein
MADHNRCFCGKPPHTIDNYCWDHRNRSKAQHADRTPEQQLAALRAELNWAKLEIESLKNANLKLRQQHRDLIRNMLDKEPTK